MRSVSLEVLKERLQQLKDKHEKEQKLPAPRPTKKPKPSQKPAEQVPKPSQKPDGQAAKSNEEVEKNGVHNVKLGCRILALRGVS